MSTQPINPGASIAPSILEMKTSKNGHSKKKAAAPTVPVESVQPEPVAVKKEYVPPPLPESTRDLIAKSMRESKIENITDILRSHFVSDSTVEILDEVVSFLNSDSVESTPSELIRCFNEIAARYEQEEGKVVEPEKDPALVELEKNATWGRILSQIENAKYYIDRQQARIKKVSIKYPEDLRADLLCTLAEVSTLHDLMVDWSSGSFDKEYPDELPLIAAIRGNLNL